MTVRGRCSWFGGPEDTGVSSSEDLAWWETWDQVVNDGAEELFLPAQPPGTTGLARRLDPEKHYIAMRWDYDTTPKTELVDLRVMVRSPDTGKSFLARPADWGPNSDTGRIADLSPGLMNDLGIETDDEVEISEANTGDTPPILDRPDARPLVEIVTHGDVRITVNGIPVQSGT